MSSKGIFSALSGAIAQERKLDTLSNNIANSNTAGFKKDRQVFNEYLTANEKPPDVIQVPRIPATTESFYNNQGGDRAYVDASGTYTDFSQGALRKTGNPLDIAIEGRGLFEVLTPNGVRFSRNGHMKIDSEGRLVNREGYPVLSEGIGRDPAQRVIRVDGSRNITISAVGEVFQNNESVGRFSVVDFPNEDALRKEGGSLYAKKEIFEGQPTVAENFEVHQGFSEMSNVNIVEEMTDMIAATRAFEANQKAIKAFDRLDERLVNDVPKSN